jgi:glycosyltransferase involved in cell wall biosynthesis
MTEPTFQGAVVVVPSLKVSGGIREALRLAIDLGHGGLSTCVLSMWASPHPMETAVPLTMLSDWKPRILRAAFELPVLQLRFVRWLRARQRPPVGLIFTHYATLPLALFVPRRQRYFFVQDLEWNFLGNGVLSALLRCIVMGFYRSGRVISANAYLTAQLGKEGLDVAFEAPIWAEPFFAGGGVDHRDIDLVMVLRKGAHKRLDLYRRFIGMARQRGLRIAAITPEDEIAAMVRDEVDEMVLRPNAGQMKAVYERSKCFIHLSEHEGFGLPPLEAMGSGCVPICRDSGGVRAFMEDGELSGNLLSLEMPMEAFFARVLKVIADEQAWQRLSAAARERFNAGLRAGTDARGRLASQLLLASR